MTVIERLEGPEYTTQIGKVPLCDVGGKQKPIPDEYISQNGMDMTPKFNEYIRPLLGKKPEYADLDVLKKVEKK